MSADGASACSEVATVLMTRTTDMVVDGFVALGPAFDAGGAGPFPHGIDFVLPYDASKTKHDGDVVVLVKKGNAPAHAAPVSNLAVEHERGLVHFHAPDVATFQIAIRADAGRTVTRHYTYRAISGPSMGGFGSSVNFWLHPDRYDAIAVMGADPGPDMTYSLGMIRDYFVGGFCTADDGPGMIGKMCPTKRKPLTDQMEVPSDFEHFPYQKGEGVGLTLNRSLFVKANRDLARAMGNAAYYNPLSPYLPPGVPEGYPQRPPQHQCDQPVVLRKFFDARYNPAGTFDVITICDGNDSDAAGYGNFDPNVPATDPVQILLAVDVNGNGKRDPGEPVILQYAEPWKDVGLDGVPSSMEPGYDPVTNPDPNGDDYHYLWNPTGTENNWRYDVGEPFDDLGIDGVAAARGSCPYAPEHDCWDYGEGNGTWDMAPGYANWRAHDPRGNLEALDDAAFDRVDVYYDAGIRDFFNAQVSTNSLMGALMARGQAVRVWDGFPAILGLAQSREGQFDLTKVDFTQLGRHVYVRYGDPDATQAVIEQQGDGRHVGTATQAVHRAQTMLHFLAHRWEDGDRKIPSSTAPRTIDDFLMQPGGRMTPYTVVLPPGYDAPETAGLRYPVVYVGHGLGGKAADMAAVAIIAQNSMVDDHIPEEKRLPKFIFVAIDAACAPGGSVQQGTLDPNGDLCEEGAFYTNHPEGKYQGEDMILQLEDEIDAKYRTRPPADVTVTE
jgi:hypothetical protein